MASQFYTPQKCAASVCMCSSHSFWTSSSLDVPARVTQEESLRGAPLFVGEQQKNVEFSTISTLESVISVSSDYLCINWYGSSLGVYTRAGVPRLQCLGQ